METELLCEVCNKRESDHETMVHRFSNPEATRPPGLVDRATGHSATRRQETQGAFRTAPASDPLLRLLLIRKGIVTPDELSELDKELRTSGIAAYSPASLGESGSS